MTIRSRRILYSCFVILFFLAAPPLILYTAGFRYDFEYKRIVETGSLVVKSNPEGARIFIDSEEQPEKTPTIINTILPGKINLLIQKDKYHDWEKTIEIKPRVTSFEESITLYADAEPSQIIPGTISEYWFNAKQDKIAYATISGELRIYNTLNQKDTLIANVADKPLQSLAWSPNSDQFVFGRGMKNRIEYFVVDASALERITPLSSTTSLPLENVQWDLRGRNSLYAIADGNLYRIPFLLKTARLIFSGEIEQYLAEEKRITLIERALDGSYSLSWIAPQDPNTVHFVRIKEISKNTKILQTNSSHRIALHDTASKTLTIIDTSVQDALSEEAVTFIQNVIGAQFAKDGRELAYTDGFGIYVHSFNGPLTVIPKNNANHLIIKYSYPIREITLAPDAQRVFFIADNDIRVVELNDDAGPRVAVLIEEEDRMHGLMISQDQKFSAFLSADKKLMGLEINLEGNRPFFAGNK